MSGHAEPIHGLPMPRDVAIDPPIRQAYKLLHFAFVLVPLLDGIDKFSNVLVNWNQYLSPWIAGRISISVHNLMQCVGLGEIIAAIIVAIWPKVGGWILAIWFWAIILNLLSYPGYYNVALWYFGLSLGALALARLSVEMGRHPAHAA